MTTNKCKQIIFTIVIITFGLTNAQWSAEKNVAECRTPDNVLGSCVVVKECKSMVDFLLAQSEITEEVKRIAKSFECGYQGTKVKICCFNKPILTTYPPLPPNVENHRNINLLPNIKDCSVLPSENRVISGNKTSINDFPWMSLLSYRTSSGTDFRCAGTLINRRYVLTAAHCITHLLDKELLGVRLGEYNISSSRDCQNLDKKTVICAEPVQDIYIDDVIPHPDYNYTTISNDIGLLRLRSPAQLKANVQPICLPITNDLRNKNFINTTLLVTGWGATGTKIENIRSDDLLKVSVPTVSEAECKKAYSRTQTEINYRQLCAGGKNKRDSCGGDSGGPLQSQEVTSEDEIRFIQFGIVSFGHRTCGEEGFPGVYTRVDYYMDWILDNIRP